MYTMLGLLIATIMIPTLVQAQTPTAFTERSKVIATDQEIHLYGLPTKGSDGKTRYFDVTVTLNVRDTGKPAGTAPVSSVPSPRVQPSEFVPGVYTTPVDGGKTCTLTASAFGGRTEFDMHCRYDDYPDRTFTATWYTGPIAGHPLEEQLTAAHLDTLPNNEEFAWGRVGFSGSTAWFGCFFSPDLFAARQIGDTLTLTNYGNDSTFNCQISLVKSTP